jgi:ribonuclease BN (tRNA processing enzyme)
MALTRRQFLAGTALVSLGMTAGMRSSLSQSANRTRLILLGTKGGPRVGGEGRVNPSTLLLINGTPYVVDCGYGVSRQLVRAGVPLNSLKYVFLTHHHSDHNLEYGPLLYNGWATGLKQNVEVFGPRPLNGITDAFMQSMKFDIETRMEDEGKPDLRKLVKTTEVIDGGVIFQNGDVKVSALRVKHPPVTEAYAYRFDAADRSIVISGDTTYFPELAKFAGGVDVLVHEAMYLPGIDALIKRVPNAATLREHLLASHTLTEDVGRIAQAAKVKTLVLSHFVPGADPSITDEMWAEGVRKHYGGKIVVGRDLMEI